MANPYNRPDDELLDSFHRENPDFDLMNAVNDELHNISAAPCRVYKLDVSQSKEDPDNIYPELIYRTYLPPIVVKMYYVEPTWTEELNRLGINMPEEIVLSTNLQRLIESMRYAKTVSSKASASINISYTFNEQSGYPFSTYEDPANELTAVNIYHDGNGRLYSKLVFSDGNEICDPNFELNYEDKCGIIDLAHPAVSTVEKLVDFVDGLPNYSADLESGSLDILSSKMIPFANWINIKDYIYQVPVDRTGGVYDNVADVLEPGDIIETVRRHEATRQGTEPIHGLDGSPTLDPVTLAPVRGKIYEVRYSFVSNETPSWHYINFNITADKIPMDSYDQVLKGLPADEVWTPGPGGRWYA